MRVALVAQLIEDRVGQRPVIVEPPFQSPAAFGDGADRAFEIGRGLLDAMVEVALVERLFRPPDPRHAAIARMQRSQMQRSAIERHAGSDDTLAERSEE